MKEPLLSIRDLVTEFHTLEGTVHAVNGVSYDVFPGETLGVVGESGSGKTVTVLSGLGLIPQPPGKVVRGEVLFEGRDLLKMSKGDLREIRGRDIAMVFQDPMTFINPVLTVGFQLEEAVLVHARRMIKADARRRAIDLLGMVRVPDPDTRVRQYPHEFSGGMRQRVMIAMAMANRPKVLIADEPTTALDVTIQAQVLQVLQQVQEETGAATILITHDLGLVAELAERVIVMYGGRVVESGDVNGIFHSPRHPYTIGLMACLPRLDADLKRLVPIPGQPPSLMDAPVGCSFRDRCRLWQEREVCATLVPPLTSVGEGHWSACHFHQETPALHQAVLSQILVPSKPVVVDGRTGTATIPDEGHAQPTEAAEPSDVILRVEGLKTHFPVYSSLLKRVVGHIRAVDGADFVLSAGETLSLVGESGCGKSTLGRTILRLVDATDGRVVYLGKEITGYGRRAMRPVRRDLQIVFQDPYASLNPRMMVRDIVGEPLRIHLGLRGKARQERVVELLRMVGLEPDYINRYPHEFSGGQRQRIGIARVLATNPKIVILDEPVSALDVSIQAQVVNLLMELQKELGIAYVFIAHDLSVVRHISNRVAVMYLGRIVEIGTKHDVFESPMHPYTQALLSAVPIPDPEQKGSRRRIVLTGDVPNPANPPSGCTFRTRCFRVQERCAEEIPSLVECPGADHRCSCFYPEPVRLFS